MYLLPYCSTPYRIASLSELEKVVVSESNEILVDLSIAAPTVAICPVKSSYASQANGKMLARQGVSERLKTVAQQLAHEGLTLVIADAWRPPDRQAELFAEFHQRLLGKQKWASEASLREAVHQLVAYPPVAGHPTGGAVDVWLRDTKTGLPIEMGTEIWGFESPDLLPTFAQKISQQHLRARVFLRDKMLRVGFAPFDGEWWHFSFGDREWGALTNQPAIYGPRCG